MNNKCVFGGMVAVCLFLGASVTFAQQADTSAVRMLHKKAISFLNTHPDSLLLYRDSCYSLAKEINDLIGIGDSYTDLGIYHWLKGNYGAAVYAYDTSNQIFASMNMPAKQMNNLSNIGMVYSRLGDFPKAISFFIQSLKIAESLGVKVTQAKTYNSLGVAYKNQGNYQDAFGAYQDALELFLQLRDAESVAGSYTNIGNIYTIQKQYDSALFYQEKAVAIFDSLKSPRGLVTCYNNISDIHVIQRDLESALDYRKRALVLSQEKGFFSNEVVALSGLGMIYSQTGDLKSSERYYTQALELAKKRNYRTELVNLYRGLADCYKKSGDIPASLQFFELYSTLKDSLFNQQNAMTIANLRTAYEVDKKEASIQLLKKDNEITKLSRNIITITGVTLLLMAGLTLAWQRTRYIKDKQLHAQQLKLRETEQMLIEAELRNAKIKEGELLKDIDYQNKALTTYALNMVQKNEMLEEVKEAVQHLLKTPQQEPEQLKKVSRMIDHGFTRDKDWDEFKLYFEEVHADFFVKLRQKYPDLGPAELKLCALIRLNLNMKQAASILRISPESVKMARHRLRKKFNLQTEDNLSGFIMSI